MACLTILEGPAEGQQFALERHRLVMVGRDDQCTFQLLDEKVSRRHLQIRLNEGGDGHDAVDFSSANGVFVNGRRIEGDQRLLDGDVITIGRSALVYTSADAPDAQRVREILRKRGETWRQTMTG